jgi:hypothetical protein
MATPDRARASVIARFLQPCETSARVRRHPAGTSPGLGRKERVGSNRTHFGEAHVRSSRRAGSLSPRSPCSSLFGASSARAGSYCFTFRWPILIRQGRSCAALGGRSWRAHRLRTRLRGVLPARAAGRCRTDARGRSVIIHSDNGRTRAYRQKGRRVLEPLDRGGDRDARILVPAPVVDALVRRDGRLNTADVDALLRRHGEIGLVEVESEDGHVKVWIDRDPDSGLD